METGINNKCKAYTSLEQSKILSDILPFESADAYYKINIGDRNIRKLRIGNLLEIDNLDLFLKKGLVVPSWSLAALLNTMPPIQELCSSTDHYYRVHCMNLFSEWHDNAVDSCVEMIIRLKEKGLL